MSEKPLLLSSARSGILQKEPSHWWRKGAILLGVLAVLVGAADVAARVANGAFGDRALFVAFAPAAAILDPSLLNAVLGSPTTTSSSFVPTRLRVPSIGVDAQVESIGQKSDGSMGTPSSFERAAWYKLGSKPGEPGNAVIDGHVNNALTSAGVFEHLPKVSIGDIVEVSDEAGHKITYRVREINEYAPNDAPLKSIFATSGPSQVVLITCDGEWDPSAHQFNKRLVVVAR